MSRRNGTRPFDAISGAVTRTLMQSQTRIVLPLRDERNHRLRHPAPQYGLSTTFRAIPRVIHRYSTALWWTANREFILGP